MRIKKTSETRPLASHTVNAHSESESNAYSCDYINGTVLYDNATGSTGEITLSDSVVNYKYIEIVYRDDQNIYDTKRLYVKNEAYYYLAVIQYLSNQVITRGKNVQLNGNKIKNRLYSAVVQTANGNELYGNNNIAITRVVGYK